MPDDFRKKLEKSLKKSDRFVITDGESLKNSEDEYNTLIEDYLVDECLFCDEANIPYVSDCTEHMDVKFVVGDEVTGVKFSFYIVDFTVTDASAAKKTIFERIAAPFCSSSDAEVPEGKHPCFVYNGDLFLYKGNLLKTVWEG
jgi:hypothetical protein